MKERYIADLKTNDEIVDFFLVKSISIKLGSNKKQYLDLLLGDSTGEVVGKKWDITDAELPALEEIKDGDIVKAKAIVTEWNGLKQLKVLKIRGKAQDDEIEVRELIKSSPERGEDMYEFILRKAESLEDVDLKNITVKLLEEKKAKLLYYPAAQKNHHAELGGLLYHMKRMLMNGEQMCKIYENLRRDWVVAGVILHDIEKTSEIDSNELGISTDYFFEGKLLGHIVQGIKTLQKVGEALGVSEEKVTMLQHMLLSHHYEPEFGSPKKPMFPEAEILHYLDMIDARMYDMEDAMRGVNSGEFSQKVRTLDGRTLYKSTF